MLVVPAVDIKNGKCVRLLHGEADKETVYSQDPVQVAQRWVDMGAVRVHVIDLDGAFVGKPQNFELVRAIKAKTKAEVQVGGGIRTLETIQKYVDAGVDKVILGTVLFTDDKLAQSIFSQYADKVMVAMDVKGDAVSIRGWVESAGLTKEEALKKLEAFKAQEIIFTDIGRDGTLSGVNLKSIKDVLQKTKIKIFASGGVTSMKDIEDLCTIPVAGCIVGKALYEGSLDLSDALRRTQDLVS